MKKLSVLLVFMSLLVTSCMKNEYLVESDYSYAGSFKNYNTFSFMTEIGIHQDSATQRALIEDAVKRRMEIQGYRLTDKNPDLLISYKMFHGDFNFYGYNQPELEKWLIYEDDDVNYEPVTYNMYEGTIIVLFWDRKKKRVVWQGYATTIFGNPNQNDKYIKWAVRSIFDQYRIFGEGLSAQNKID